MGKQEFEEALQRLARVQDQLYQHRNDMLEIENELAQVEMQLARLIETEERR